MKPGKRRPKSKQEKAEVPTIVPVPEVESPQEPAIVPVNLLAALKKIRDGEVVPVFITKELEKFLTEQGVYRDDMRPAEAWEKLNEIAGNAPEPEPPAAS